MRIVKYKCDICKRTVDEDVAKITFNSASYTSLKSNWEGEQVLKQLFFQDVCYSCISEISESILKTISKRLEEESSNEN